MLLPKATDDLLGLRMELRRLCARAFDQGDGVIATILETAVRTVDQRISEAGERQAPNPIPAIVTALVARNVRIGCRRTTVKLEADFWRALEGLGSELGCSVDDLCTKAHALYDGGNLASAIRIFTLRSIGDIADGLPPRAKRHKEKKSETDPSTALSQAQRRLPSGTGAGPAGAGRAGPRLPRTGRVDPVRAD
ncbi:MAG: ribbon-helix-helix domain-containing protein [Magnetospirillum sp.]|nr:ribbon-helix-helix domain-containing protein [Magnetospirillum sp.]